MSEPAVTPLVAPPQPACSKGCPCAQVALSVAWLSGVFCIVVCVLLAWNHGHRNAEDMRQAQDLAALKTQLLKSPEDEPLKQRIRALDLAMRQEYFQRQAFADRGTWLLVVGAILFAGCAKFVASERQKQVGPLVPVPGLNTFGTATAKVAPADAKARLAVGAVGLCLTGGIVLLLSTAATGLTARVLEEPKGTEAPLAVASTVLPTQEEYRKQWPRFRGPDGQGVVTCANVPTEWDGKSGKNILWRSTVPLPGHNSPLVWGDRIFMTGADADKREVFCFDGKSGQLSWRQPVGQNQGEPPSVMDDTGFAASTAATDGLRVYAIFATGDLACFDLNGKPVWNKRLGKPDNQYGFATSLITWKHLLLVQFDQGGAEEAKSKLLALDGATGRSVWEAPRPVGNSWSTPIVISPPTGEQLITCAKPWVISYEPATGKEFWRAECLDGDVAPSPVYGSFLVFVANANAQAAALKIDGAGDVSQSHIAWKATDGLPDICSPLCDGERVYLLASDGTLTCYNAAKGEKLWDHNFETTFKASPSLVGNRLYLISAEGVAFIVEAANTFKEVGRAALGEGVQACPAFQDGRIYIRGEKQLYAVGAGGK